MAYRAVVVLGLANDDVMATCGWRLNDGESVIKPETIGTVKENKSDNNVGSLMAAMKDVGDRSCQRFGFSVRPASQANDDHCL